MVSIVAVFSVPQKKHADLDKLFKYAKKGYITQEEFSETDASGTVPLDEEYSAPDGSVWIFTLDDNGQIMAMQLFDKDGNSVVEDDASLDYDYDASLDDADIPLIDDDTILDDDQSFYAPDDISLEEENIV